MFPGHLEIGNRETELCVPPRLRKSAEYGAVEDGQWIPPTTTPGKEAKIYSIEDYYSQDRSPRAYILWLSESILFVCLFWYCFLSFFLQPPWNLLLDARNQLVKIQTENTTLIDKFDTLITPFSVTTTFLYILCGTIPLILIISSWNIGLRVTKDVIYRNFALHTFVMLICFATLISTIHLQIVISNFDEERITWMIETEAALGKKLPHSETFLGKLEAKHSCCGFRTPLDYWNTKNYQFRFGSYWFYECLENRSIPTQFCWLPKTCSSIVPEYRVQNISRNVSNSAQMVFVGESVSTFTHLKDMTNRGCNDKIFFSWFYYFLFSFLTLALSIICCIIIMAILTYFSIDKADNQLLDQIHQGSENKLQFEIKRLERKAKTLPTKEKEIFLLPFVYNKDLHTHTESSQPNHLSIEPKKN